MVGTAAATAANAATENAAFIASVDGITERKMVEDEQECYGEERLWRSWLRVGVKVKKRLREVEVELTKGTRSGNGRPRARICKLGKQHFQQRSQRARSPLAPIDVHLIAWTVDVWQGATTERIVECAQREMKSFDSSKE